MSIDTPIEHDTIFIKKKSDKPYAPSVKKRATSTVSYKSALNIGHTLCTWEEFYKKRIQDWTDDQFGRWTKSYFKFSDKIKNLQRDYVAGNVAEDEYNALRHLKEEIEVLLTKRNQRTSNEIVITARSTLKTLKDRLWKDEELILVLDLYFQLEFSEIKASNPQVQEVAKIIGRTNDSVKARLFNYEFLNTGRGLSGGETICKPIWDRYVNHKEQLHAEAAAIFSKLEGRVANQVGSKDKTNEPKRGQWSLDEDNELKEAYDSKYTIEEMSELLGRSYKSIIYHLEVLSLISKNHRDELLEKYDNSQNATSANPIQPSEVQKKSRNLRPIDVQKYHEYFKHLNRASKFGSKAPHKVILLLSIINLYEDGVQQETPKIRLTPELKNIFKRNWGKYVKSELWECDITSPWRHMYFEPFWNDGIQSDVSSIDEDLHILLKNSANRDEFRKTLLQLI